MAVPAYGLSILRRQLSYLGDEFCAQYPHDWLVWEPGPWRPAGTLVESNFAATQQPTGSDRPRPAGEDAICFLLRVAQPDSRLTVGRATTNDIVINDLTASRRQFVLHRTAGAWMLEAPHGGLTVAGAEPRRGQRLTSGLAIVAGDVRLTFLSAAGMVERLAERPTSRAG